MKANHLLRSRLYQLESITALRHFLCLFRKLKDVFGIHDLSVSVIDESNLVSISLFIFGQNSCTVKEIVFIPAGNDDLKAEHFIKMRLTNDSVAVSLKLKVRVARF